MCRGGNICICIADVYICMYKRELCTAYTEKNVFVEIKIQFLQFKTCFIQRFLNTEMSCGLYIYVGYIQI